MASEIHDSGTLSRSIFREVPEEISEDWTWGVLIGGMAAERDTASIARAYKQTGDILVQEALDKRLPWEFTYPILFNYRHALELYLKAVLRSEHRSHDLSSLVAKLGTDLLGNHKYKLSRSAIQRLHEFAKFDPKSTTFRYADTEKGNVLEDTEKWVDLRQLFETMNLLSDALEALILDR